MHSGKKIRSYEELAKALKAGKSVFFANITLSDTIQTREYLRDLGLNVITEPNFSSAPPTFIYNLNGTIEDIKKEKSKIIGYSFKISEDEIFRYHL